MLQIRILINTKYVSQAINYTGDYDAKFKNIRNTGIN